MPHPAPQDVFGNTPLINLAKKSAMTSKYTLGQRLETAVYLLEKGARIDHRNREGFSAMMIAIRDSTFLDLHRVRLPRHPHTRN